MKATRTSIGRAVDQPVPSVRFYLFYGQDEAQSRDLARRLLEALGATKYVLAPSALKSDPAMLVDEAGAMSLFGGKRLIWIEPATRDIEDGVAAFLSMPAVESPVVAIGGMLPRSSALIKIAESSQQALAFQTWLPDSAEAARIVSDLGRRFGLRISPSVAQRIADSSANDQAIAAQELQKFALYLGASPEAPKELDYGAVDEVGAGFGEGDFLRLADLALVGEIGELAEELAQLPAGGSEAIPVIRSLQRRILMLAPARARIERGERLGAVMTSFGKVLFSKEKSKVERMLAKWTAADLATVGERAGRLERSLMFTKVPDQEALGEELLAIARKARSL
ncbi:MAG TPA: DNA polymerase III subunit delta [Sphingomicrobium sp.]|nr:DNA polymerase III subunit delta [Sphingomicrobium sp.]